MLNGHKYDSDYINSILTIVIRRNESKLIHFIMDEFKLEIPNIDEFTFNEACRQGYYCIVKIMLPYTKIDKTIHNNKTRNLCFFILKHYFKDNIFFL